MDINHGFSYYDALPTWEEVDSLREEWLDEMQAEQSGLPGAPVDDDIANTEDNELPF